MKTIASLHRVFILSVLLLPVGLFAEEAPEPQFDLIGDVIQKVTAAAAHWDASPTTGWALTADLKPKFTFGPVSFKADSSWTIPMTASLTSAAPTVAVSEAYFRIRPTDSLDLTFGQKRFALGVGQTFTVGDSINPVIGFFDQKTGFRGATAEWAPASWVSVAAAASTEVYAQEEGVTAAVQASMLLDELQLTVSTVGRRNATLNPALGLSYDIAHVIVTAEAAAEFLPRGVRPQGAADSWTRPEDWTQPALSGSVGARWAPSIGDWDVTLSGEWLHWGQGWTADETAAWKGALPQPAAMAARKALPLRSQENAFFRAILSTGGVFSVTSFAAVDLQDASVLAQVATVWAPWDSLDLTATLQTAYGDPGDAWEFIDQNKNLYQLSFTSTYHF